MQKQTMTQNTNIILLLWLIDIAYQTCHGGIQSIKWCMVSNLARQTKSLKQVTVKKAALLY